MKTQSAKASATKPQHSRTIPSAPKKLAPTPQSGLFATAATTAPTTMPASTTAALTTTTTTTTTTTYSAPHSESLSLDKLISNIESHYNKNNDFKPLIDSLKKLLGNKIKIDKNDNKNIQKLDLILRINGFPENLNALHNSMEEHKIAIIPFLNEDLVNNFENILQELENNKLLPPNFSKSKEKWKKEAWSESDISKVEFHRVKKEVSSNITQGDRDEKHVSFCSVFLSQEIEKEIIKSLESDQQKLEKMVGFRNYVIDGAQGTWIKQRHTAADHVQPFSIIRKRVQTLFKFINNDTSGLLKDLIIQKYAQYFIMGEHAKEVLGTKYLYMSLYNYLDNLWLMDHSINSTEKGEIDPIEWLQKNDNFGKKFAQFLSNQKQTEIDKLVDKQFIIYTLKKDSTVKKDYLGRTIGKVAKDWVKINPEILVNILNLEYDHSRSERLLYFVKDLLKEQQLDQKDRDELQEKLSEFIDKLDYMTAARNELRENLFALLNKYKNLFNPHTEILARSPVRNYATKIKAINENLASELIITEKSKLDLETKLQAAYAEIDSLREQIETLKKEKSNLSTVEKT